MSNWKYYIINVQLNIYKAYRLSKIRYPLSIYKLQCRCAVRLVFKGKLAAVVWKTDVEKAKRRQETDQVAVAMDIEERWRK